MDELEKKIIFYIEKYIPSRLNHSIEMRKLAIKLAKKNNVDIYKASLASLLHDTGKRYSEEEMREMIKKHKNIIYPAHYRGSLLHSKVSVIIAENCFNITDSQTLSAIDKHTEGDSNMTTLEKIIYMSDYLEPTRNLETANKIREYVFSDFDKAFLDTVVEMLIYVVKKNIPISQKSIELYNSLVLK